MRTIVLAAGFAALGSVAQAGVIERACLTSERSGGNPALCGCIQQAADLTLTASDQRVAARFFKDPQKAQDTRQSSVRNDSVFWERYKNFGATAEAYCALR